MVRRESAPGPSSQRRPPSWGPRGLAAACVLGAAVLTTVPASAQTGVASASSSGKGIAAGILLGAEAVVLAEAAIGVRPRWAYLLGAGVGAAGGGVGGYFLESHLDPKSATLLLAGGLVLAIPATVVALSASAYSPPRDYVEDVPPLDEPLEGAPQQSSRAAPRLTLRPRPPALVGIDDGWSLGVPAIALLDVYPMDVRQRYGLARETELRVSVLAMRF